MTKQTWRPMQMPFLNFFSQFQGRLFLDIKVRIYSKPSFVWTLQDNMLNTKSLITETDNRHDVKIVFPGGTKGCHNDNLRWHQWWESYKRQRQTWHDFSVICNLLKTFLCVHKNVMFSLGSVPFRLLLSGKIPATWSSVMLAPHSGVAVDGATNVKVKYLI